MGTTLLIGLMLATLIVLILGVALMARGGEISRKYSNRAMVARVTLQGLAVAVLLVLMLVRK